MLRQDLGGEQYAGFTEHTAPSVLKEGIHTDPARKDKIASLARYKSTKSEDAWVSLDDYVKNMKADQKEIFYINLVLLTKRSQFDND